ncbi:MAG: HIT domain-containing protein [Deltaproteobacteria bacterium]
MEVTWAPWRMEYILADQKEGPCIFCPGENREQDAERLILFAGKRSMVIMNRYPYNNGHLLVAPVRHVGSLDSLSEDELLDLMEMVRRAINALKKQMNPEGFNVGINLGKVAGAGVEEHLHVHIVPRWNGDTNYMTVVGALRVIPEHIRNTYEKLLPYFQPTTEFSGGDI